jgi:hypothetical protein
VVTSLGIIDSISKALASSLSGNVGELGTLPPLPTAYDNTQVNQP